MENVRAVEGLIAKSRFIRILILIIYSAELAFFSWDSAIPRKPSLSSVFKVILLYVKVSSKSFTFDGWQTNLF